MAYKSGGYCVHLIQQAFVKMSVAPLNMVERHKFTWVHGRWRDLLCYTSHQDVVDDFLDARMAVDRNIKWCFHGTPLSSAHKVFEEGGLRAGEATHQNHTGVFIICSNEEEDYSLADSWRFARNRARCYLCDQWIAHDAPSAWSMPVVIMFPYALSDLTWLFDYKDYSISKYVINRPVGSYVRLPEEGVRLLLDYHEYLAWCLLHAVPQCSVSLGILNDDKSEKLMMCGGKLDNPFHWSDIDTEPHASCGRVCRVRDLKSAGWKHSRNKNRETRIYRCPLCSGDISFSVALKQLS